VIRKKDSPMAATLREAIPALKELPAKEVEAIVAAGSQRGHPEGTAVVREGDEGVGFHLILEGTVRVEAAGRALAELGRGSFFGEVSMLDGKPRTATVTAITALKTFSVPSWSFKELIDGSPGLARILLAEMAKRVRGAAES
jgi:voltage-gated potassium channel